MRTENIRWIYNRKSLFGLCVLVMGLGMALILLAVETMISERVASIAKLPQRVWQQEAV